MVRNRGGDTNGDSDYAFTADLCNFYYCWAARGDSLFSRDLSILDLNLEFSEIRA
jgi:hypothetical protein